jgi:hypothetical protein
MRIYCLGEVNRTYISKLEKGESWVGLEILVKSGRVLSVEPAAFVTRAPDIPRMSRCTRQLPDISTLKMRLGERSNPAAWTRMCVIVKLFYVYLRCLPS